MRVAIHQPNFFPWLPFFQKMEAADVLVVLSECQFEKNGYQNRFNIADAWYTMATRRGLVPIAQKVYVKPQQDWAAIKARLPQYADVLSEFDSCIGHGLLTTNVSIIRRIAGMLGINTRLVHDWPTANTGTDRLVEICQELGATQYISGPSGKQYMDASKFEDAGVEVSYCQPRDTRDMRPVVEVLHGSAL